MIRLEHISKTYSLAGKTVHALNDVSLQIHQGEVFGIIGRSGAGKSTLIRMLNLLEQPSSGQVWVQDQDITRFSGAQLRAFRQGVGMVFQHFNLFPHLTVLQNITLAPIQLKILSKQKANERGMELLKKVGLEEKAAAYPSQLSGGQKQRVAIARSLVTSPQVILADEPTGALDSTTSIEVMEILKSVNREGMTIVMVTHDPDMAAMAQKIIRIKDGIIGSIEKV